MSLNDLDYGLSCCPAWVLITWEIRLLHSSPGAAAFGPDISPRQQLHLHRFGLAVLILAQASLQLNVCVVLQVFMVLRDWHGGHKSALKRFREGKAMVRQEHETTLAAANLAC